MKMRRCVVREDLDLDPVNDSDGRHTSLTSVDDSAQNALFQ